MPLIVRCKSCGFVLYQDNSLKSLVEILDKWGRRCPCCMSPLDPFDFVIRVCPSNRRKDEK